MPRGRKRILAPRPAGHLIWKNRSTCDFYVVADAAAKTYSVHTPTGHVTIPAETFQDLVRDVQCVGSK